MSHSFVAYIDESGDDGLKKFRVPGRPGGSSQWLCICACVMRASQQLQAVRWRDEIKEVTGSKKGHRSLHFADLSHAQKRAACQIIHGKPLRYVSALFHKPSTPDGTFDRPNQLYFYATRYVVERLSWFCRDQRPDVPEGNGQIKIVFSRRGGLSIRNFKDYLQNLKAEAANTAFHWPVIDIDSIEAKDHSSDAGLQLADCGASAIAAAFEPDLYGNVKAQYLHALERMIYERKGNYLSYGLKIMPGLDALELNAQQAAALRPFK